MKVLVCGGRDYDNWPLFEETMDGVHEDTPITLIINGGAFGADNMAMEWAFDSEVDCLVCPAKWGQQGRSAGPIRNQHMLEYEPDLVVAFPGGKGTADMVRRAEKAEILIKSISCATAIL